MTSRLSKNGLAPEEIFIQYFLFNFYSLKNKHPFFSEKEE